MAKLATLIDDFQDNVIDGAKWTTSGTVAETGGRAQLTPTTSFSFWGTPVKTYDLTSSQVVADIPTITANGSTGTLQSGIVVDKDASNLIGLRKVAAQLVCTKSVAGVETQLSFTPYNAINHRFWRIRADATNIYWETSATGVGAFFIQNTASIATLGFAITSVGFYMYTGYAGVELFPGTFQIESVNPGLPIASAATSTSTGSLALTLSIPGEIAASGASTSTGDLDFTLVAPSGLPFASIGSSASTGSLALSITGAGATILTEDYYYFEPPVVFDLPPTLPPPVRPRYINAHARWKGGQRRGRSVLKVAGVYSTIDTPTVDQTISATEVYQGGHIYTIPRVIAQSLVDAGYTVTPATVVWSLYPAEDIYPTESLFPGYQELVLI